MPQTPTVTVHFTQAIIEAALRLGLPLPEQLVAEMQGRGRVGLDQQDALWEQFCRAANDPLAGLELGLAVQVGHLDTAGMILLSCETLGEALECWLDYHPIVGEGGVFRVARTGEYCEIRYEPVYRTRRPARVEAVMATMLNLTRWMTGERFEAESICLRHAAQASPERYRERLGAAVHFGTDCNALVFGAEQLALPLIHANPLLCQHLRGFADQLLARLDSQALSARVDSLQRENPRWGKEKVAAHLGMSGRHLNRRLADEGTGFKLLRDAVLRGVAEQALVNGRPITEVAAQLGFSDASSFAKAFKRWTGHAPARYRRGCLTI